MQTCAAALRLPVRMSVERVSGCWWAECPDGVESAGTIQERVDALTDLAHEPGYLAFLDAGHANGLDQLVD